MSYPNYPNKHNHRALFSAEDFVKYKGRDKLHLPEDYIFLYQTSAINYFLRKYRGKYHKIKISSLGKCYIMDNLGVIKMTGIGSPHASTVLEELIALGGKRFLNIGTAGGLQKQAIYLCERAIRDEGTSSHYIKHSKYSYPDERLTQMLGSSIISNGGDFDLGTTWTIDTPYRETKKEVMHYREEGVATVEMEAAALFAIAKLRKVKLASAFAVSDLLVKKWEPKFHEYNLKRNLALLIDSSIRCLKNKE